MSANQQANVMQFQANRANGAPRRWTYWIAIATAVNGVMLLLQQDLTFLVGLVLPFAVSGPASHFIAAAAFGAVAYLSALNRAVLLIALVVYVVDTLFAAYLSLWSGVIMHVVVLFFVGIAMAAGRRLNAQLAADAKAASARILQESTS